MANKRHQLTEDQLENAGKEIINKMRYRAAQKGMGVFASNHEILGYTTDEVNEYRDAVHGRLSDEQKVQELIDIAVCALWGIASIRSGGVDW
jgi:hypothetical protein